MNDYSDLRYIVGLDPINFFDDEKVTVTAGEIRKLLADLDAARADAARMDWIRQNAWYSFGGNGGVYEIRLQTTPGSNISVDIDAAMKEKAKWQ